MDQQFSPFSQPELPLEIVQGATFVLPITYVDDVAGGAVNLTDYTAIMEVRSTADSVDPALVTCTTENALIVISGSLGLITITIPASTTATLEGGTCAVYDLFITAPSTGVSERLLSGPVLISKRVSK